MRVIPAKETAISWVFMDELARLQARTDALVDRTMRLHRMTAHLSTATSVEDVSRIVIDEGSEVLGAKTGALWRVEPANQRLVMLHAKDYPAEALAQVAVLPVEKGRPVSDAVLTGEPVWLSSRADYEQRYPESATRSRSMAAPAAYSTAALPVMFNGVATGVIALTFEGERAFDPDEQMFLMILALHCAQGFERARIMAHARDEAQIAEERAMFKVRAGAVLASSLDYEQTLRNVAELAVPRVADWCGVELIGPDGVPKQVAVAHVDPAKVEYARQLALRYPPDRNSPTGAPNVLRTGVSELYPQIPEELLAAGAVDAEHLRLIRELGLRSAMVVPIKDRDDVVGVMSFIMSGDHREYTAADLAMAEQLAQRAGAAIANAKLYDQATTAVRVRDEFLLVAGHELRTPLAAMALHHQALAALPGDTPIAKVHERAAKLTKQGDRLSRLVDQLLDVSRISAGRLTLERTTFDLAELVRDVSARASEAVERAGSTLNLGLAPVVGSWDRDRLDQVITNLVTNAIKYGQRSAIDVRIEQRDDAAVLAVSDRGIGIATEDQGRVFERFERAVSPRNYGGLGLGLWIVRQLVIAHAGTIAVTSELGVGSTFTVTLPLR
jgi:signal transduction histidine kinase